MFVQALEPLYTEGADDEVISPYKWAGANAAQYDPEAQNPWGDLPMAVSAFPTYLFSLTVLPTAEGQRQACDLCMFVFVAKWLKSET